MIKQKTDYIDLINNFDEFCRFIHLDKAMDMNITGMNDFIYELEQCDWDYSKFDPHYLKTLCERDQTLFSLIYAFSKYIKT